MSFCKHKAYKKKKNYNPVDNISELCKDFVEAWCTTSKTELDFYYEIICIQVAEHLNNSSLRKLGNIRRTPKLNGTTELQEY